MIYPCITNRALSLDSMFIPLRFLTDETLQISIFSYSFSIPGPHHIPCSLTIFPKLSLQSYALPHIFFSLVLYRSSKALSVSCRELSFSWRFTNTRNLLHTQTFCNYFVLGTILPILFQNMLAAYE